MTEMNRNRLELGNYIQYIHEFISSIGFASILIAFLFQSSPAYLMLLLYRMDRALSRFFGLLVTDFTPGYFAFCMPTLVVALCLWIIHRWTRPALRLWLLEKGAGVFAIAGAPAFSLCTTYVAYHRSGWNPLHAVGAYEFIAVLICVWLYLRGAVFFSSWVIGGVILLHWGFWIYQYGVGFFLVKGAGTWVNILPLIGTVSSLMWLFYRSQNRYPPPA